MTLYAIIQCPKCKQYIAVREGSKTFRCPYCGTRNRLLDDSGKPILRIYMIVEGRRVPEVLAAIKSGKLSL
ncbi:MAG TPA: hypothetical protein EYH02_02005 [Ignisphaera aggregans]|uniref:DUF1922 domain-containing protein n=1 Tax=Ignisphaera aggregans TaxID=334771 RepID=A0A833DUV5_9CREN|nr:hypothetical protein [Ignisphaera aggregans]